MSNWQQHLSDFGATLIDNNVSFSSSPEHSSGNGTLITPLCHLGVICITSEKVIDFLQGQTTCDFKTLSTTNSLPGAQCNPKGRMLNSFTALQVAENEVLLIMDRALVEPTLVSLGKFAPFFKAVLADASEQYAALGVFGESVSERIIQQYGSAPEAINESLVTSNAHIVRLAEQAFLVVMPFDVLNEQWQALAQHATAAGTNAWQLQMIEAGLGQVVADTHEMFIPQMLNLQATGAISFKKGCYTGQEVVARMKYLGKLKRRMYRINLSDTDKPSPGAPCKLTSEGQSVGNIVLAADNQNTFEALAVLTEEAAQATSLIVGDSEALPFQLLPLPYNLEAN